MAKALNIVVAVIGLLFAIGVVLLIVGGVLFAVYGGKEKHDSNFDVDKDSVLAENSTAFRRWLNASTPTYRRFYVFDVLNPADVVVGLAKPHVRQRGPYTYRVESTNLDVAFSPNGSEQLSYTLEKDLHFERALSNGTSEDDFVTVPNIPIVSLAYWIRFNGVGQQGRLALKLAAYGSQLFANVTVRDLLWGYHVQTWDDFRQFMSKVENYEVPAEAKFGMFYKSPGTQTAASDYAIWTGVDDISKVHDIYEWNGNRTLSTWPETRNGSQQSNMINGTDGTVWPPHVSNSTPLYVFDPLWCRSVHLTEHSVLTDGNLTVSKFVQTAEVYDNANYDEGFCTGGSCMPAGALNASVCRVNNIPFVFSEPHFYQADPRYAELVDGLEPNCTEHESFVHVEPTTGRVVKSSRKLQLNVNVQRLKGFAKTLLLNNDTVFPVLWMDESFEMSAAERDELVQDLAEAAEHYRNKKLRNDSLALMIAGGALVLLAILGLILAAVLRKFCGGFKASEEPDERSPLLRDES